VVRFDATKVDADTFARLFKSAIPDAEDRFGEFGASLKSRLEAFKAAGGSEVIAQFSTADLRQASLVVVPLREGGDEAALRRLLEGISGAGWRVDKVGQALVAGPPTALARRASAKASERSELPAALAAAGDGCLQVLLLPTDDQRRVVEEALPLTRALSHDSARTLTRGVRWAALGLNADAKPLLHITARAANGEAAESLAELVHSSVASLGSYVLRPAEEKPLGELLPTEYKDAVSVLNPTFSGDRVSLTLADVESARSVATLIAFVVERRSNRGWDESGTKMKHILLAFHNYLDSSRKTFPPTAIRDKNGKPLLSWRVAILPFVEEKALYNEFHLDEPWDSEHNQKLIGRIPAIYRSPRIKDKRPGLTTYLVPVGKEVAFTGDDKGRTFKDFTDGTSNTIMLVDVADDKGVIWTQPEDLAIDLSDPKKGLTGHYAAQFLVGMADGSLRFLFNKISNATLRSAFTVAGGETLGPDW